jgi:eukaryotic-like serine/threonine-protein kinase
MMISKAWFKKYRPLIILSGFLLVLQISGSLQFLEERFYFGMMSVSNKKANNLIEIVAIDDESIKRLGGYPLSRATFARSLEQLKDAKLIVLTLFLDKMQHIEFNKQIRDILQFYEASSLVNESSSKFANDTKTLSEQLRQLNQSIQTDQQLAEAIRGSGKVILNMPMLLNNQQDTDSFLLAPSQLPAGALNDWVFSNFPPAASVALPPLNTLSSGALAIGASAFGTFNSNAQNYLDPLLFRYRDHIYPSLVLQIARNIIPHFNVLQNGIQWGDYFISTDTQWQMRSFMYPPKNNQLSAFNLTPLYQVHDYKVASGLFKDKIVLIGLTASSRLVPSIETASAISPPVISLAHSLSSILNHDVIKVAQGSFYWQSLFLAISFVLLSWRFSKPIISFIFLFLLIGIEYSLLIYFKIYLSLFLSILLICLGILMWGFQTYLPKIIFKKQDGEANRLLGLVYQGQGKLELAYEKFTQCPIEENILASLYNLALDFERKYQLEEALKTYYFIYEHDPDYRDCNHAIQRLETRLGNFNQIQHHNLSDWLEEYTENRKPMIGGRFQIEKKIAKGAMGVVYLGRELKLDRMIAIKTLTLSKEFEGSTLQEVLERFFREASAAGRLTHEHIISIYDAGEDDDIAYLAMEYFKGGNLVPYTRIGNLLSLKDFFNIAIKIADALHYAHLQGVIHRDIKPANILYNHGNQNLKITDFGIARITDHQQTKTGVVLGTPSYMSPEQIAGKVIDGRSDLFSLGITFYELLSGELPFQSNSMTSLMYKIATEQPRHLSKIRPDLPMDLCDMIATLLEKNPEQRYSDGSTLAQALRDCQANSALKTEEKSP